MSQEKRVSETTIRANLKQAGAFFAAYQMLRNAVVDRVRAHFLAEDWDYESYDQKVLSLHRSRFHASLLWLAEVGALDASHIDEIHEIRRHRNRVAFELPGLLNSPTVEVDASLLDRVRFYVERIEKFLAEMNASQRSTSPKGELPQIVVIDYLRETFAER